ncbi:MAG: aminopeptidase P family protein [Pseudomonadota bacterium]
MIQKFISPFDGKDGPARLGQLRAQMAQTDLDGFLVPRADAHQGEEVTARNNRLAWLTGFSGSAGFCAVLRREAGIFVDGRYRIQVKNETQSVFTPIDWPETKLADWLIEHLCEEDRVGFDPWLHTYGEIEKLRKALLSHDIELVETDNLIDRIWEDQPDDPDAPLTIQPLEFAGEKQGMKRTRLAEKLKTDGADAAVLTTLDSVAWLTNTRGQDLTHMPVAISFAILYSDGALQLFVDPAKVSDAIKDHLGSNTKIKPLNLFERTVAALDGTVLIDPKTVPYAVWSALQSREEGNIKLGDDPTIFPRACKNHIELSGAIAAHIRDGAAVVKFLHWLDGQTVTDLTEIDIVKQLEAFRAENEHFHSISFDTISGSGPNGAIIHYRVSEPSNRKLKLSDLLLIDSGAQYRDGTTDITRTIALGDTTEAQRLANTAVLKGMIALSQQRFPEGVSGGQLDAIARAGVWNLGLDYAHGTGHGVGSFLSVHEGPQRISKTSDVSLQPGMILSNEPGFYLEGEFGIRIENLIHVIDTQETSLTGDRILAFETLTLAPIDRALIEVDMLSDQERAWLNVYHQSVLSHIGPIVPAATQNWLKNACASL